MLDLLQRLTRWRPGASSGDDGLAARLLDYPPFEAPHAGPPSRWTRAQADDNLAYLLNHRAQRLDALAGLLRLEGIDIGPVLQGQGAAAGIGTSTGKSTATGTGTPAGLLVALHAWAKRRWPELHQPALASSKAWIASSRRDAEIVYSLLMDLALLLGELVMQRHPGYRWALDLDEQNRRDGMYSFNRPVLQLQATGDMPSNVVLDLEHLVVGRFVNIRDAGSQLLDDWARVVEDAASGKYEAAWKTPSKHGSAR
jgi:hypothetical protein